MTIRQIKRLNVLREHLAADMCVAVVGCRPGPSPQRVAFSISASPPTHPAALPRRPDASIINESIPLFYVGRNQDGIWVVREAEGCSGGIFLSRGAALRFARKQTEPLGCAMMFPNEPFELDVENRGSRIVVHLAAALDFARRRAPALVAFITMMIAEWCNLVSQISRACASERRHRQALESELFRGQYILSSKNDDDAMPPS